jgi:catechol 2,3-dioxygenase-like lactoylglutathione lyase family enzyme
VKFPVEVITLPVSDVERALRFYVDRIGFTLDVDYAPNDAFRVVQLTPPGSSCSIQMRRLLERGVEVGEIRHKAPVDAWAGGLAPGLDPARRDYASFAGFRDPDGNSWVLQERGYRTG